MVHGKIRRATGVLAAVLLLALGGCSRVESVQAQAGETVSTALFDFTVAEPQTLDAYPGIQIPDGRKLVTMLLTVSNTSDQTYTCLLYTSRRRVRLRQVGHGLLHHGPDGLSRPAGGRQGLVQRPSGR